MPASIEARLPTFSTPFIGRDDEIEAIAGRLADTQCRLLTLVGPGGMGKTRLAVEIAKNFAQTYRPADGIYFVDLQPVNAGELLVTVIANAIGIVFSGSQSPREQLLNTLSERETIILLDNFEQLLDSVDLLSDIIKIAPNLKILMTSREALNIQEEWIWQVGGLQVPDHQADRDIQNYSSVQLFAERARRTRQDFSLVGQEVPVTRICQLVDGMPLALELAASWTKALSCAEIASEIQRSINFLTTNMRNIPERHRNIQAVFDYSWHLLTDDERTVFPKLSIFRGGFRREAAEQVAGASLRILAGLVDKSFLQLSPTGRYTIHELMRQYGAEHLDPLLKNETQDRHSTYYAGFLHQRQATLRGAQQAAALDEIGYELDNIRVSWEWAVEHDLRDNIHQSMHTLFVFCHIWAQALEGERLFNLAVKRFEHEDSATLAYLLLAHTWMAWLNGRIVGVEQFIRAIRMAYVFWSEDEIAMPLKAYIGTHDELISNNLFGDQQREQVYRHFLELFRVRSQRWGVAFMLHCLGEIFLVNGKLDQAEKYFRESQDNFLQMDDRWASAWSSMGLAHILEASKRYHEAHQVWQEHSDICTEVGDRGGAVYVPAMRAKIACKQKDYHAARLYIAQGIKSHLQSGSPFYQMYEVFQSLIAVFESENRNERAVQLLSFQRQQAHKAHALEVVYEIDPKLASLAQKLPPDIYQQAIERGATLNWRAILKQMEADLEDYAPESVQTVAPSSPAQSLADPLTERELEVLRLLAAGRSNREIAQELVLALGTVKWYISEIYSKLGVASRTQAIARAGELHLIA